jgi:hypothetical protein
MSTENSSKLEFIVNMLKNLFHKKNIIIFLGKNGIMLCALRNNKVHEHLFIEYGLEQYHQKYREFLLTYKAYPITLLLDHNECELDHEMLPILNSLIKVNPVEKFISEKYQPEDIVAYNIYEIDNNNGEVWNTCIATTPFLSPLSDILNYIIKGSFKYSGIYFLSLELGTIIDRILHDTANLDHLEQLQIFTIITKASNIRIIVKYKNNIMSEKTIEFPYDKSDLYLTGTIEQAISDKLLFYKQYIKTLKQQPCIIFLVDNALKSLVSGLKFENCNILPLSGDDLNFVSHNANDRFQDSVLIELFNNTPTHMASNKSLKTIAKYTLINRTAFKPVIAIISGMILTLCFLKYQAIGIQSEANDLNKQYYKLAEEYREVQKRNPKLSNVSDLLEMYNLQNIIARQSLTPLEHHKILTLTQHKNLKLKNLSWKLVNPLLVDFSQSDLLISLDITYQGSLDSTLEGIEIINGYANHVKVNFQNFHINFTKHSDDIKEVARKVTIPAHFSIEGKVGGITDAR